MNSFDTLIFGASFYGLSRLLNSRGSCVVIERTVLMGSEFVDSLNECSAMDFSPATEFGKSIKAEMENRGIIDDDGNIYAAPTGFLLCELLKEKSKSILFSTEVTDIKKVRHGYEVTIFNSSSGFSSVFANEIIDTSSEGVLHNGIAEISAKKSLNIAVKKPDRDISLLNNVVRNALTGINIFEFPVALTDDMSSARSKLYSFWIDNKKELDECKIIYIANTFAYKIEQTCVQVDSDYYWMPACGFRNLLEALDVGSEDGVLEV